jgi:hypothetical protein
MSGRVGRYRRRDQPLGPRNLDISAPVEVAGPRLLRSEVDDMVEAVPSQQLLDLFGNEQRHERLAHFPCDSGKAPHACRQHNSPWLRVLR